MTSETAARRSSIEWRHSIEAASGRIAAHVRKTPVIEPKDRRLCPGGSLVLKLEQLQFTGSFKARGAFNSILSAPAGLDRVVAVSGGNHGAAVAFAAANTGLSCTVFAPELAGHVKLARMRALGADVEVCSDIGTAFARAETFCRQTDALFVHPYDQLATIEGQGTVGSEWETQSADLDTLLVAVGGGGLIAGIAAWFQGRVRIVAVESTGTATLAIGLRKGRDTRIEPFGIAASALGAQQVGAIAFDLASRFVDRALVVSDDDIIEAQRRLWESLRLVAEPGGVTALAALTSGAYRPSEAERVGVLVCGANADPNWFVQDPAM
jgi:threonine dehydratase